MSTRPRTPGSLRDPVRKKAPHLGQRTFIESDWQALKARFRLTPREMEVVRHLFDSGHRPQIAAKLGISAHTVDSHLRHIFAKAHVEERGDLILVFVNQVENPQSRSLHGASHAQT